MGVEYIMMIGSGTVCSYTLFSTLCHACAKLSSSAASNVASQLSSSFPLTEVCRAAWRMSLLILSAFYLVLYLDLVLPELTFLAVFHSRVTSLILQGCVVAMRVPLFISSNHTFTV